MRRVQLQLLFATWLAIMATRSFAIEPTDCQQCQSVLAGGVFNRTNVSSSAALSDAFRAWQCTSNFGTHAEAHSLGIDIGVPVYDVPLQLGLSFSDAQKSTWKSANCSSAERNSQSFSTFSFALRTASPDILNAWTRCIERSCGAIRDVISCSAEPVATGVLFKTKWLRSTGDNSAPRILSFRALDAQCDTRLSRGTRLREADTAVVCRTPDPRDIVLILETTRGTCSLIQSAAVDQLVIEGRRLLTADQHFKADRITFRPDAILVTNGFDVKLEAKELLLEGSPHIVSFEPRDGRRAGDDGRDAGRIELAVQRLSGTSLTIDNRGENGIKGAKGPPGAPGAMGGQGSPRDFNVFNGCIGGSNGGRGGNGDPGLQGRPGGNGGSGGNVRLQIGTPLMAGGICRLTINTEGGAGGDGGDGGDGGPGGPGGRGAPGTTFCGGTDAGPPGDGGAPGPRGEPGRRGACGEVRPDAGICGTNRAPTCGS